MLNGFSTNLALMIVDKTKENQIESLEKQPIHKRAIEYFKENISKISNVDEFVDDYKSYSFVMKAFGLEDQIFGKAMMKKILSSDIRDKESLINRMTDSRFREIYKYMGFQEEGTKNPNVSKESWQNGIIDKYLDVQFENQQYESNPNLGTALYFERKASSMKTWYHVIGDKEISSFMRTALGLPDSMGTMPVEKQKKLFESKFDITKLQNPYEVDSLQTKYAALSDAKNATAMNIQSNNPAMSILNNSLSSGFFAPITIDITSIGINNIGGLNRYR
jgi:hypothetical protein